MTERPRTFRYEDDMAWYRDRVLTTVKRVKRLDSPTVYGSPKHDGAVHVMSDFHPVWEELDSIRKSGVDGDTEALLVQACGLLLHDGTRRPLMDLYAMYRANAWDLKTFLMFLRATVAGYEHSPPPSM